MRSETDACPEPRPTPSASPTRRSTSCWSVRTPSTPSSCTRRSGPVRSTPTTPSSRRACSSTSGRWSTPRSTRSRCPSPCARSTRVSSPPRPPRSDPVRVVLGVGGGIAAYKACSLLRLLTEAGHDVTVVPTASALHFVGEATWSALSGKPVHTDVWSDITQVPHVRIGQSADLVVVAPATADLLARAATGQADDLLTNVLLTARCPVVVAPAMHTEMWEHAATQANVATLTERGVHVVPPASGRLTGRDSGPGRLPEPEELYAVCARLLARTPPTSPTSSVGMPPTRTVDGVSPRSDRRGGGAGDLTGRRVVVTAGGTREPLDPVRYLGNRSSGKQGHALAEVAAARGARVTLLSSSSLLPPPGVEVVRVETALDLEAALAEVAPGADAVVMAAAVADFRPAEYAEHKIKKTHAIGGDGSLDASAPVVSLVRNPDIL